jgi:hypothetical protein
MGAKAHRDQLVIIQDYRSEVLEIIINKIEKNVIVHQFQMSRLFILINSFETLFLSF